MKSSKADCGQWAPFNRKKTSKQCSRLVWWIKLEVLTGRRISDPRSSSNTVFKTDVRGDVISIKQEQ